LWLAVGGTLPFVDSTSGPGVSPSYPKRVPVPIKPEGYSFAPIPNNYKTIEEVQQALRDAGLESSNLIIGIDYTKSNTWTGKKSFNGKCLHDISPNTLNPYQEVIRIIGRTLEGFDDDNKIPVFGFGDAYTRDKSVFPFYPNATPANGLQDVLSRYTQLTPSVSLSGPTSFVPLIREAINIIKEEGGYHILLIIADGQVSSPETNRQAIVEASKYPLSIVLIGVGDGPWELMHEFDDELPNRRFDNFQFVEFNDIIRTYKGNESAFAMHALMEIPEQYQAIRQLGLL